MYCKIISLDSKYILLFVDVLDCVPKAPNYLLMFVRVCICNYSRDQAWKTICPRLECNYNTCYKFGRSKSFWLFT
jgi:hypothetical protein